jgi:4-hydroxybenzoyl-CoA thioesterase
MSEVFVREKRVRFHHCDPAGIVFYPQYFVLFHELMEDWFREGLGIDYAAFVASGHGLPTVKVECEFLASNPLGDLIAFELMVERLGNSSLTLRIVGRARGMECLRAKIVAVHSQLHPLKAAAIPEGLRSAMGRFVVDDMKAGA